MYGVLMIIMDNLYAGGGAFFPGALSPSTLVLDCFLIHCTCI